MTRLRRLGARWIRDAAGQDLVEYALLAALVGVTAAASAPALRTVLSGAYSAWVDSTQDLWVMPPPE
jgi:Flp pilus assembly pilin Flp